MALAAVAAVLVPSAAPEGAAGATPRPLTATTTLTTASGVGTGVWGATPGRGERAVSRSAQRQGVTADAARAAGQPNAIPDLEAQRREAGRRQRAALAQERAQKQAHKRAQERARHARQRAAARAARSWQLPVPHGAYRLTARFGSCSGLWSHCHTGLDFAAPTGVRVHAVAAGTITATGSAGAYGNRTVERLTDGTEVWYCHQSAFGVHTGQKVAAGQVIGAVGSTGNVTGPHVHLEVRPRGGDPVDPYPVLVRHGLRP
jgi:murein DD-endopeptidase MepM/ murein hydrolase activator NlpD